MPQLIINMKVNAQDEDFRNTNNKRFKMRHAPYLNRYLQFEEMMRNLLIILTILALTSCSNENEKEKIISKWDNGNSKVVHEYIFDSDSSYNYLEYNEEGKLITKGRIDNDIQNGEWKWWYDNGQVKDIAYLENGFYIDRRLHFNEKGDTTQIEIIDKPTLGTCFLGQQIYFVNNRRIIVYQTDSNGERHGFGYQLNEKGDTSAIFNYTNGLKQGLRIEFDDNEIVSAVGEYENDLEEGRWFLFDKSGSPLRFDIYNKGEKVDSIVDGVVNIEFMFKDEPESKIEYYKRIKKQVTRNIKNWADSDKY